MTDTAINRNHATIHTATISIKVMRIDRKQVTLATFRQLDEESIFLADGTLRGVPWGRVSYTWQGCKPHTDFFVVWQDGDHLKRSPVPTTGADWDAWVWDRNAVKEFWAEPDDGNHWLHIVQWCEEKVTDLQSRVSANSSAKLFNTYGNVIYGRWRMGNGTLTPSTFWGHAHPLLTQILERAGCGQIEVSHHDNNCCALTCQSADLPALIAYLERTTAEYRDKHRAAQEALGDWNERYEAVGARFWTQVEAMRKLDQLFIAT
jgi:hypothetical protein